MFWYFLQYNNINRARSQLLNIYIYIYIYYIYIYIYIIYIYIYIYIYYIYIYIYIYIYVYIYLYIYYIHLQVCLIDVYIPTHKYLQINRLKVLLTRVHRYHVMHCM